MPEIGPESPLLRWLTPAYAAGAWLYHGLHDRGWLRSTRLPVPVLSVGNLVVGGTGKTPAVMAMARELSRAGKHVVILTRGYGGNRTGVLRAGIWETGEPAHPAESGDEPLLLSRAVPTVPLVVHPRRSRAALDYLRTGEPVDLFLLDDGFQHRVLARDRNVVLVDGARPFGPGRLLPAGTLREHPRALARADHLLVAVPSSGAAIPPATGKLLDRYAGRVPRTPTWTTLNRVVGLESGGGPASLDRLEVLAVSGIARPERYHVLLEGEGAIVHRKAIFRDHQRFTEAVVSDLEKEAKGLGLTLVTTTKDAVRLEGLVNPDAGWCVVDVRLDVEGGWLAFLQHLHPEVLARKESGTAR